MKDETTPNKCFIVFPTDDEGSFYDYEGGHFGQVYNKIIEPSVLQAGYIPVRRDEIVVGENAEVEIMKELVSASVVLFDISIKCGWVLTVLGIRNSYKSPVVVMQDDKSIQVLNNDKFDYIEYSHLLTESSIEQAKQRIIDKLISF